jgi:hypothetical protein
MLIASSSVIVHDLGIPRRSLAPLKAYPPLIVDANAVLSTPVAMQSFEPITRRHPQIIEAAEHIRAMQRAPRLEHAAEYPG